jgi:hypothetical protein
MTDRYDDVPNPHCPPHAAVVVGMVMMVLLWLVA